MPRFLPLGVLARHDAAGALSRRLLVLAVLVLPSLAALRAWAVSAGLVSAETSVLLFSIATIAVVSAVAWWSLVYVLRTEQDRRAAESSLGQRQASLLRLSERLEQSTSAAEVLKAALDEVTAMLGYRSVWACLFSDDGESASVIGVEGDLAARLGGTYATLRVKGDVFLETLLVTQDALVMEDAATDPRANSELASSLGIRTVVCAPMMLAERKIGMFGTGTLDAEGVRPPDRARLDYHMEMTTHVAVALDRIRLLAERATAVEETRALNAELNQRVIERTRQLEFANRELEAFSYSVSHDLRAPLRHVDQFSRILLEDHGAALDPSARRYVTLIQRSAATMKRMIDDLLQMAWVDRQSLSLQPTDLADVVKEVVESLRQDSGERVIHWDIGPLPTVSCDPGLVKLVFTNLLSNAVKYTGRRVESRIRVGCTSVEEPVFAVEDNGAGFDQRYAGKLFGVFQRLHRPDEFEGTGIGLATVQRIVHKHGGRVWAEAEPENGARFFFTLGPR